MRNWISLVLAMALAMGLSLGAWAGDGAEFRGLIPGSELSDQDLARYSGKGVQEVAAGGISSSGQFTDHRTDRLLKRALRRVSGSLKVPAAPDAPAAPSAASGAVATPRLPRLPRLDDRPLRRALGAQLHVIESAGEMSSSITTGP